MKRFIVYAVTFFLALNLMGQNEEYEQYYRHIDEHLTQGRCEKAQRLYGIYKQESGRSDDSIENRIVQCLKNSKKKDDKKGLTTGRDTTLSVNGEEFTMVWVEGGTFTMGCTSEQGNECRGDEKPMHSVTIGSYYVGETEVTQGLWKVVMGNNPSYYKGDDLPVERVSWNDVQDFIRKLNTMTGRTFRLPTEAEWEYAARGGRTAVRNMYSGSNNVEKVAWYYGNSGDSCLKGDWRLDEVEKNHCRTHPVKEKMANGLGLYDMSGNVWEWCNDLYGSYSGNSQTNPQGSFSDTNCVFRGGSWFNDKTLCRTTRRGYRNPSDKNQSIGFRLVMCPDNVLLNNNQPRREERSKNEEVRSNQRNSQTIVVSDVTFKMVWVEGGTFAMGCTMEQSVDCEGSEEPTHSVALSGYYIGEAEVTRRLWKAVMGSLPTTFMRNDNVPVDNVSWNDAQEFVRKLNAKTGRTFRLPTEAEWEYAARGGNRSKGFKYSGSNIIEDVSWYECNSGESIHPVKQKKANELGLYDMSGNVYEFCNDRFGEYDSALQTNPQGAATGAYRVIRGGCYDDGAKYCRNTCRIGIGSDEKYSGVGLRVVLLP